jgi:hypothetical protein
MLIADHNIRQDLANCTLTLHPHHTFLPEVLQNPRNKVAFFLREPLARFVSGFNHRQMDVPTRRKNARNAKEARILRNFASANDLAEALTSTDERTQDRAYYAMETEMHARLHYTDWLVGVDYLHSRMHRIAFIGFQESFGEDVRRFFEILGVQRELDIPHERRTPETAPRELSELAQRNLRNWYAGDIAIFNYAMGQRHRWA